MIAALLGALLYLSTLGHQYVLDDHNAIDANWIVKSGLNAESVKLIFTTEYRHGFGDIPRPGTLYRPLPLLMFAAEWQLSPNDPRPGHAVNVLIYALTGWLLWATLRRVLADQPPALIAAAVLLFMAHPVHTEVVANIKSRDEILSLFFSLTTLYAMWQYLDTSRVLWLAGTILCYTLALFSKESAITLLAVAPLTIWFFRDPAPAPILRASIALLIPAIAFLAVRHGVIGPAAHLVAHSPLDVVYWASNDRMEQLATAFMMSGRHFWTLVWPNPLISDMGYPQVEPVGFGDMRALAGLGVHAGLFIWALAGLCRKRVRSYAVLFYLLTFSVASNIFIFVSTYAERMLYLPSLGFVLLLAWGCARQQGIDDMHSLWNPNGRGRAFWGTITLILLLYGYQTLARNPDWHDDAALFSADLPKSPDCTLLNHHLGLAIAKQARAPESGAVLDTSSILHAIDLQSKAIHLYPGFAYAWAERGACYLDLGEHEKAMHDWENAVRIAPDTPQAQCGLGFLLAGQGRWKEGEDHLRLAIAYSPSYVEAYSNLGVTLAMQKRYQEAISVWKQGLAYEPENVHLMSMIGSAYKEEGKDGLSTHWLQKARSLERSDQ